jgi:hypothetical protein
MSQYANSSESEFPSDLIEAVQIAHENFTGENVTEEPCVYVLAHERMLNNAESEFIIEGVFSTLDSANQRTMDLFKGYYTNYQPSDFYAQGVWQNIGGNSVGWYVSGNGTLALEIHDNGGRTCRIYAERHEIE